MIWESFKMQGCLREIMPYGREILSKKDHGRDSALDPGLPLDGRCVLSGITESALNIMYN